MRRERGEHGGGHKKDRPAPGRAQGRNAALARHTQQRARGVQAAEHRGQLGRRDGPGGNRPGGRRARERGIGETDAQGRSFAVTWQALVITRVFISQRVVGHVGRIRRPSARGLGRQLGVAPRARCRGRSGYDRFRCPAGVGPRVMERQYLDRGCGHDAQVAAGRRLRILVQRAARLAQLADDVRADAGHTREPAG